MFGSVILDVAIGLILIYLILSFVSAALREAVEVWFKHRAKLLHQGIDELLHDPTLTKDLYEHPLIGSLYRGTYEQAKATRDLPSYIPSRNFAIAMLDMVVRGRDANDALSAGAGAAVLSVATLRQNIGQLKDNRVQRVVLSALDLSGGDVAKVQQALETWFNASMDRVSGWYKRRSQQILIAVGLLVAGLANVDTLRIAKSLYNDPGQRQAAVAMANSMIAQPPAGIGPAPSPATTAGNSATTAAAPDTRQIVAVMSKLDSLSLPIGWPDRQIREEFWMRILGWITTALAISLGAPFWFDLLNQIMIVRSTVKPHQKSGEEASDDRQPDGGSPNVATPAAASPSHASSVAAVSTRGGATVPPGADYRPHEWSDGHGNEGAL